MLYDYIFNIETLRVLILLFEVRNPKNVDNLKNAHEYKKIGKNGHRLFKEPCSEIHNKLKDIKYCHISQENTGTYLSVD